MMRQSREPRAGNFVAVRRHLVKYLCIDDCRRVGDVLRGALEMSVQGLPNNFPKHKSGISAILSEQHFVCLLSAATQGKRRK